MGMNGGGGGRRGVELGENGESNGRRRRSTAVGSGGGGALFTGRRPRPLSLPPLFDLKRKGGGWPLPFGDPVPTTSTSTGSRVPLPSQFSSTYKQKFPVSYSTPGLSSILANTSNGTSNGKGGGGAKVVGVAMNGGGVGKRSESRGLYACPSFTFSDGVGVGLSSSPSSGISRMNGGGGGLNNTLPKMRRGGGGGAYKGNQEFSLFLDIMETQERFAKVGKEFQIQREVIR